VPVALVERPTLIDDPPDTAADAGSGEFNWSRRIADRDVDRDDD
jgi:hypothetical protein